MLVMLALHALTGGDSVATTYGIGKSTAITLARKGYTLDQLGQLTAETVEVTKQATHIMASVTDGVLPAALGAEHGEVNTKPV